MNDKNKNRCVHFISNNIYNPKTGGEIYNLAMLEGAKSAGFEVVYHELSGTFNNGKQVIRINFYFLQKVMKFFKSDILVLDTDFHARYFLALFFAKYVKKIKIVGMLHHYNYLDKSNIFSKLIHYKMEQLISRSFDYLLTNSNNSLNNYLSLTNNKEIEYSIISPFVRNCKKNKNAILKRHDSFFRILTVGTIDRRKNLPNLIKGLKNIDAPIKLDIVGGIGSNLKLKNELDLLIDNLNLKDVIKFHGWASDDVLDIFFKKADLFALVSLHEGYGMVYTEAMRYGLPIVGTKRGAVPELVLDGKNGILCNPLDVCEINTALLKFILDQNFTKIISKNNIEKYKYFYGRDEFIKKYKYVFSTFFDK